MTHDNPIYHKYLANAKYMISSWTVSPKSTLIIPNIFLCMWRWYCAFQACYSGIVWMIEWFWDAFNCPYRNFYHCVIIITTTFIIIIVSVDSVTKCICSLCLLALRQTTEKQDIARFQTSKLAHLNFLLLPRHFTVCRKHVNTNTIWWSWTWA